MAYKPGALKITGWILKGILYSVIVFVVSLLVWRIWFSTKIPDDIKKLCATDELRAAYELTNGDLTAFKQDQASITRAEDSYGYFSIVDYVIIPEADEVQLIFRYNNSTLEHLAEDYGLGAIPEKGKDSFHMILTKTTDLTPDDKSDNTDKDALLETRYEPTVSLVGYTKLYTYYRYVFDGVEIGDDDIGLFADIYYVGDIDYTKEAYGTLCLYDHEMAKKSVKLTKKDIFGD